MKLTIIIVTLTAAASIACGQAVVENRSEQLPQPQTQATPEPTKPPIPTDLLNAKPEQLCSRLAEIKTLPTFEPTPTDPIYEALIAKGDNAIPCLIEHIRDRRIVPDPRYSVPTWDSFAVGDTAFFILLDILSKGDDRESERLLLESLPPKSREEWKTNGIYAYFNYVLESKNRKALQQWWKNWLNKNKK